MPTTLPNIGLRGQYPEGFTGWGPEVNRNFNLIDRFLQLVVASATATTPTDNMAAYLVPVGASGPFAGKVNNIAVPDLDAAGWLFYIPKKGWTCYAQDTGKSWLFDGTSWVSEIKWDVVRSVNLYATNLTATAAISTGDLSVSGVFSTTNATIANITATTLTVTNASITNSIGAANVTASGGVTGATLSISGLATLGSLNCLGVATVNSLTVTNNISGAGATFSATVTTNTLAASTATISSALTANAITSSTSVAAATLSISGSATMASLTNTGNYSGTTGAFTGLLTTASHTNTGALSTGSLSVTGATTTAGITNTGNIATGTLSATGALTCVGITNTGTSTSTGVITGSLSGNGSATLSIVNATSSTPSVISQRLQAGTEVTPTTVTSVSKADGVLGSMRMFVPFSLEFTSGGGSGTALRIDTNDVSPEGVVTARPGSLCPSRNGNLYVKATGTGNTGWKVATLT